MLTRRRNMPTIFNEETTRRPGITRFSDLLDDFFEESMTTSEAYTPRLNVAETDNEFEVTVALPGMSKKEIDVSIDNNVLTISGERKQEQEQDGRKFRVVEHRYGQFSRSLTLPNVIDQENVKATYQNGELIVTIPKLEEKAGKKVDIK